MKIRNGFVTNSSSVSYIVTMNEKVAEGHKKWASYSGDKLLIFNKLKEIVKSGKIESIGGYELFTKTIKFNTDGDMITDSYLDGKKVVEMTDEELVSYIYGAYLVEGKISEMYGFGSTQVEQY